MIRIDTFAAVGTFLGALLVTLVAYRSLLRIEHPPDELLRALPTGKQEFNILDGESCIGHGSLSVEADSGVTILTRSQILVQLGERRPEVSVFVGAFFNALEQLVRANVMIEMQGRKIEITFSNPNPIHVHVGVTAEAQSFGRDFVLPGPIFLRPNGDGTFRLDTQATALLLGQVPKPNFRFLGWSGVHAAQVHNPDALCLSPTAALPLDELTGFARKQLENWRGWLMPMMDAL